MILVTGGAGFIGSHTCVELAAAGEAFVILDNFSNSQRDVLDRLAQITGQMPLFEEGDVRDGALLARLFAKYPIDAVIHFAASKAVGESVAKPLAYYDNNVSGTVALLQAMQQAEVRTLVFSSSATVYAESATRPIAEDFPLSPSSPYGQTKLMIEQILADLDASEPQGWRLARLRYFNPVGAHESGLIGEDPQDTPNNLMPFVAQVATGQRAQLRVFGNDYATVDGTGVRDYIHVTDLAKGHLAALKHLRQHPGLLTVNLGSGRPASVLQLIASFARASGRPIPYEVIERRAGDLAQYWADPALAERLLGWRAELDLDRMCADAWRWQDGEARRRAAASST